MPLRPPVLTAAEHHWKDCGGRASGTNLIPGLQPATAMGLSQQPSTVASDDEHNRSRDDLPRATGQNGTIIDLNGSEYRILSHVPNQDVGRATHPDPA